jgi:hypothetical protein
MTRTDFDTANESNYRHVNINLNLCRLRSSCFFDKTKASPTHKKKTDTLAVSKYLIFDFFNINFDHLFYLKYNKIKYILNTLCNKLHYI